MPLTLSRTCMTKVSVFGSFAALVLSLTTGSALAQEDELEEITVTGSRIARDPNLTGALPVQSVGSEQIQLSGEFSISDVVNDVPALLSSVTGESSIDAGDDFDDGINVLDLRASWSTLRKEGRLADLETDGGSGDNETRGRPVSWSKRSTRTSFPASARIPSK